MSGKLWLNQIDAAELGLKIGGINVYDAPGREVQTYRVPGRIGEIYPKKDLSQIPNQIREYTSAYYRHGASRDSVSKGLDDIRAWCMEDRVHEIRDSYEPGIYRLGWWSGDFSPVRKGAGENFEIPLRFSCDPRRFIANAPDLVLSQTAGTTVVTPDTVLGFPIREVAKPLLYVSTDQNLSTITFEDDVTGDFIGQIKIAASEATDREFYFDAEDLTAHYMIDGDPSADQEIEDVLGEIRLGPDRVRVSVNVATIYVRITPRWWVR